MTNNIAAFSTKIIKSVIVIATLIYVSSASASIYEQYYSPNTNSKLLTVITFIALALGVVSFIQKSQSKRA
jgi:hypothetical protein